MCQSNISYADIPLIQSQKTIKFAKSDEKTKVASKLLKKKKSKLFKEEKVE